MYTHVINHRRTNFVTLVKFIDHSWLKYTLLETDCLLLYHQYVSYKICTENYKFDRDPNLMAASPVISQISIIKLSILLGPQKSHIPQ